MARLHLVQDVTHQNGQPAVARLKLPGLAYSGRPVLGAIDLTLLKGETVALTGPSGVGKTTLVRVLAGLEARHQGQVDVPENITMVFQEPTLLNWRNLVDNLRIPLNISEKTALDALARVGLAGRGADFPKQLSLGQQRRLSLARAFAGKPDLLLMDEPFVSLDDALADDMMSVFESLRADHATTTLIVTHSKHEAKRLASRVLDLSGNPAVLRAAD